MMNLLHPPIFWGNWPSRLKSISSLFHPSIVVLFWPIEQLGISKKTGTYLNLFLHKGLGLAFQYSSPSSIGLQLTHTPIMLMEFGRSPQAEEGTWRRRRDSRPFANHHSFPFIQLAKHFSSSI
jgi:hypothetical protein